MSLTREETDRAAAALDGRRGGVLIASDDQAFARALATRLRHARPRLAVSVRSPPADFRACGGSCGGSWDAYESAARLKIALDAGSGRRSAAVAARGGGLHRSASSASALLTMQVCALGVGPRAEVEPRARAIRVWEAAQGDS